MKFITAFASLLSVATVASATDGWSIWELYCGDSCDSTTLTASGDLTTNVTDTCTSLGATYEYCHLEIVQEYGGYAVALSSVEGGCDESNEDAVVDTGSCSAAGSWAYYQVYYYF